MYTINPYAQAGWSNPQNPLSINNGGSGGNGHQPPTFGALPTSASPSSPSYLSFLFISRSSSILNSSLIDTQNKKYYDISTEVSGSDQLTVCKRPGGDTFAVVEWQMTPLVQVNTIVSRQPTSQWIGISSDRSMRMMRCGASMLAIVPSNNVIHMYNSGSTSRDFIVRLSRKDDHISLDIAISALQMGLLEPVVAAAILLYSGRPID